MCSFGKVSVFFLSILAVLVVTDIFFAVGYFGYVAVLLLYAVVVVWGVKNIQSGMFLKAHCKAPVDEQGIALTFDDGPSEFTPEILDILNEFDCKAAFFCVGKQVEKMPEILKRIDNEGHIIGNHSHSHHFWFDLKSSVSMLNEFRITHELVRNITTRSMKFMRPPYGVTNPPLSRAVKKMNYTTIGWSLRSLDTGKQSQKQLLKRMKRKLKYGDIILLHDNRPQTPPLLWSFLEYLEERRIEVKRIDTLLNFQAYDNQ